MILVTSANGKTGRHILAALRTRGLPARAFDISPQVADLGAEEWQVGDMLDAGARAEACQGVSAVIHTGPPFHPKETVMGQFMIDAAKAAGVEHVVYISVTHPQTDWLLNHKAKLAVENALIDSRLAFTILQPMHYMQNIDVGRMLQTGGFANPYSPDTPLSFVDMADLAEAAASVVGRPEHHYATYEICGTDVMTTRDIARTVAERSGKPMEAREISIGALLAGREMNDYLLDGVTRLFTYYGRYGIRGNANVARWLLGREPTTFVEYVDRSLAAL